MKTVKRALRFVLCLLPVALAAGYCTALYMLDVIQPEMLEAALAQLGSRRMMIVAYMVQTAVYTALSGFFGFLLANAIGLMRPFRPAKAALVRTLLLAAIPGVLLGVDPLFFPAAVTVDQAGLSLNSLLAALLYGGVVEELMMRLLMMSLIAFVLWKIFARKAPVPVWALVAANVLAALLFAAGHLPANQGLFGALTPVVVLRCFVVNGCGGLVFGHAYRRYGIGYAMIAHMGAHIISKLIWLMVL